MTDLKLGILLWSQAATWAEQLDAAQRVDRLGYDHLWTWDHLYAIFGDPYQPIFEGWTLARRLGDGHRADAARPARRAPTRSATPGSSPRRPRRSTTSAAAGRSSASAGRGWTSSTRPTASTSAAASASGSTGSTNRSRAMRARARRRVGDLRAGRPLRVRRPAPPAAARPAAPADHDRRQRREEDAADGRALRRHVERDGPGRRDGPQGRRPAPALRRGRARPRRDRVHARRQGRRSATPRPRRIASGEAAMAHNRTPLADVADDDTFWNGTPEQLAERLAPVRRARLPDGHLGAAGAVRRRDASSASSARSSRWSTPPRLSSRRPDGWQLRRHRVRFADHARASRPAATVEFDHVTKRYDAGARRTRRAPSTTCR